MPHRVVVTGIGPVTSAGIGKKAVYKSLWNACFPGRPAPAEFTRSHSLHSQWYVPLPEVSPRAYGLELSQENLMQPADRMAVLAAKLALEDAQLAPVTSGSGTQFAGSTEAAVILGVGLGSMQTALPSYLAHCVPRETLAAGSLERPPTFSRLVVPKTMPNSAAVWVSISLGLSGPCHTLNASCASGTYAVGEAFRRVKDGYEEIVLTGGVECFQDLNGFMMRGFDILGVLTRSTDGRPRPFGRERSGFLFAEGGACILVLEELQHALDRHAPIYAEILDFRANSDAFSPVQMDPEGKQIARLLSELSAGRKIDYVNAHGTGTLANDQLEAKAIQSVFGNRGHQPWINSTKGILGHTLGASGAIEAAVTALSIARGSVHPNLTEDPMPELNLPLEPIAARIDNALSVSYGFGGHNGGLLLSRFEGGAQIPPLA